MEAASLARASGSISAACGIRKAGLERGKPTLRSQTISVPAILSIPNMPVDTHSAISTLWKIFFSALAIRWAYILVLYATMGEPGLKGVDSYTYVEVAHQFAEAMAEGSVHGWDWLGPHPAIMPLYSGFISSMFLLFGKYGPLAYVLTQCALDSATCVFIFLIAQSTEPRCAVAAAFAAVVNPTQIVISGLIYPDTPFVFFVALSLYATVRWLQNPSISSTALIAVWLCCAALIRVLIVPWTAILVGFLLFVAMIRFRLSILLIGQLSCIAITLTLCAGLVVGRNVAKYDAWALTSQGGIHLMTVVPWVGQAYDGTPWTQGHQEMMALAEHRFLVPTDNPFEESRRYTQVAAEAWRKFGLIPTVEAWIYGAVINLGAPAIILSPPLIQIPRTGFYGTPGNSMAEKMTNFLLHSESALYSWAMLTGIVGLLIIRIIQMAGVVGMLGQAWHDRVKILPITILFALWFCFILAVNGPVASPKYRLPLEPMLNILTGMGFCSLWGRRERPPQATKKI
jgi:4-amino-4-deoxy-L-arabinose transferase-like glycosyltransferase